MPGLSSRGLGICEQNGEAGGGVHRGPIAERRSRQEALSARVSRAPPPRIPAPPTARVARQPEVRAGPAVWAAVGRRQLPPPGTYARGGETPGSRANTPTAPYNSARAWRAVMTSSVALVTSEGHGGGSGTLADGSSAEEKALCPAPLSGQRGSGAGPGGRSRGGLRSRASSYPGGQVSAGTALGPSLSLAICKWAELRVTGRI